MSYAFDCRSRFRVLIRAAAAKSQVSTNYCSCSFRRFEPSEFDHLNWPTLIV